MRAFRPRTGVLLAMLSLWVPTTSAYVPAIAQPPSLARRPVITSRPAPAAVRMGVPKFFRWLTERFPQINVKISEGRRETDYVDNFYLDMNGIIHTCTHGDDASQDFGDEEAMVARIFEYTDRLISIANPRKVLYLAIDGVAPRAKMNQQRSRRYRVPRELKIQQEREKASKAAAARSEYRQVEGKKEAAPIFDSNCITPGTAFLANLGERYKAWIEHKMATDEKWRNGPTVIFSGADVPGEGEHKIMDFIRETKGDGTSAEEVRHCMYGLDADLIMLGMITHETHFSLLRERQKFQRGRFAPRRKGQKGRGRQSMDVPKSERERADDADFVFLELELLRQCLAKTMKPNMSPEELGFEWETERAVDDFVFLCMLVGNDFIPGLSNLDVADGALNLMLRTYTELMPILGGYITDKAKVDFDRFETLVQVLAENEFYVVSKKIATEGPPQRGRRATPGEAVEGDYKRRYYLQKLGLHPSDADGRRDLVLNYLEGLCWCLAYYHEGCRSWDWYFADFYAPLASDLKRLSSYKVELSMGKPFPPLAQLLSVLPPQSGALVPPPYRDLMLSPSSPIYDAFPVDFRLDQNGKRNEWEAIALLPFIDEERLLAAIGAIDPQTELSEAERARNKNSEDLVYSPSDYQ